jgi:hypothetical protein
VELAFPEHAQDSGTVLHTMKVESRVRKSDGKRGFAMFEAYRDQGRILLVLDKGQLPGAYPVLYHPAQHLLIPDDRFGFLFHYVEAEIDIQEFEGLPSSRRGFCYTDLEEA